jgi:hypothetical protein
MAKANANSSMTLSACAGLLAVALLIGCGGASGGTRGTGGATGSGGTSGGLGGQNGGLGGTIADAGSGVGGNSAPLDCPGGVDPAAPLLVDFSPQTWMPGAGKWSPVARDLTGSRYSSGGGKVADGGLTTAITNVIDTMLVDPNFEIKGTVVASDYGFGLLSFDKCVNTHTYTGVQFTVGGTTGGCDLYFLLQTFDQQGASNRGGCTGTSCYAFPRKKIDLSGTAATPVTVYFSELANTGMPATADAMKTQIVGFQWQLQSPPPADGGTQIDCTGIDLTFDNVGFATGTPP